MTFSDWITVGTIVVLCNAISFAVGWAVGRLGAENKAAKEEENQ